MAVKQIIGGSSKEQAAAVFYTQENEIDGYESSIQPVVDVGVNHPDIVRDATANNATTTIYTTPSNKDFYLTNVHGIAEGNALGTFTITIDGVTRAFKIKHIYHSLSLLFVDGLKIDRNTNITITSATTENIHCAIVGFTKESIKKNA